MIDKNQDLFYNDLFKNDTPENIDETKDFYPEKKIYKISEINKIVKNLLESNFSNIWIHGEISNSKLHSSGHFYFSLKDETSQLTAVMFKHSYNYLKFKPEDGLAVVVKGNLTCFVKGGKYQINCTYIEPQGIGALKLAFEQLKQKLQAEGLFNAEHKKPLPKIPQRIGIVTSPTGAAIRDMLSVIKRRYANIEVLIYPVNVQGEEAKYDISQAIKYLNKEHKDMDLLLIGRGGGSIEDLWAFNEEIVARAIFESDIPTISCVGHEIDFVISDFVADLRAPTPSAAAELVTPDTRELIAKLEYTRNRLLNFVNNIYTTNLKRLELVLENRFFKDPKAFTYQHEQTLDYLKDKLNILIKNRIDKTTYKLENLTGKLKTLNPTGIIKRGYSIVRDKNNKIIKSVKQLTKGNNIIIQLADGKADCEVTELIS